VADLAQEVVQEAHRERIAGLADAQVRADARDQAADERDRAAASRCSRRP
jgi:hypothetical protein